jgi:multidrug efflux pump subunit AcrB
VNSKSTVCKALAISLIVSFISSSIVSIRLSPVMAGRGMIRDSHAGWFRQLGG